LLLFCISGAECLLGTNEYVDLEIISHFENSSYGFYWKSGARKEEDRVVKSNKRNSMDSRLVFFHRGGVQAKRFTEGVAEIQSA
jgi:hypothetical protein